jgi:hypothetical protein
MVNWPLDGAPIVEYHSQNIVSRSTKFRSEPSKNSKKIVYFFAILFFIPVDLLLDTATHRHFLVEDDDFLVGLISTIYMCVVVVLQ